MSRHLSITRDNSSTLYVPELDEYYHSVHGAVQESMHVFINPGLKEKLQNQESISIFEVGFGTGLNAVLSLLEVEKSKSAIEYHAIEKYPLTTEEYSKLNFPEELQMSSSEKALFLEMHSCQWNSLEKITDNFTLYKIHDDLVKFESNTKFDLIYFDAFAPSAQPKLWTEEVFKNMFKHLKDDGFLLTYCVKGDVRRAMKAAGLFVSKLPGPPGKREMAKAKKNAPN